MFPVEYWRCVHKFGMHAPALRNPENKIFRCTQNTYCNCVATIMRKSKSGIRGVAHGNYLVKWGTMTQIQIVVVGGEQSVIKLIF
ncbi:hypothetical protein [Anaplasma phagocytophilum]|uniref:hypothetical protein n=1 Tax=Anaplasma phagocytophilum TaxID=948 RepID=UPI00201AF2D3